MSLSAQKPKTLFDKKSYEMVNISTFKNISKEVCEFLSKPQINNFSSTYIHRQEFACDVHNKTNLHSQIDIMFVVPSAIINTKRRQNIRASELYSFAHNPANRARLLFFLGSPDPTKPNAVNIQKTIDAEVKQHGDIVQESYTDVYRNILLKAVAMLRWASTFCTTANYVIRTDDDVRINVARLVSAIHQIGQKRSHFILAGRMVYRQTGMARVPRGGKYSVSKEDYPNSTWPEFALGGLLGYPIPTVRLLYEASLRLRPVWLDDVFITGMCGSKVNATLVTHPDFNFKH